MGKKNLNGHVGHGPHGSVDQKVNRIAVSASVCVMCVRLSLISVANIQLCLHSGMCLPLLAVPRNDKILVTIQTDGLFMLNC